MTSADLLMRLPNYFTTLIEAMQDGFVLRAPDGSITEANRRFCEIVGFPREEVIGTKPPHPWWDVDASRRIEVAAQRYMAGATSEDDLTFVRKDNVRVPVVATSSPLRDAEGTIIGYIGSVKDITERARVEAQLREAVEYQRFMADASAILSSSLDYRSTLHSVARLAVPRLADWCAVDVLEDDGTLALVAIAHADPSKVEWAHQLREQYPVNQDAPSGVPRVVRTGEPQIYPEFTDEYFRGAARDAEHLEAIRAVGLKSAMIVPLTARGRVLGAITLVSSDSGRRYGQEHLAQAMDLAQRAAMAVDNARLFADARNATRQRDQFLAVAAHELRSPLTATKGFAQLLLRRAQRLPGGEEWLVPLQTIDNQVNKVVTLVNRLLDVSRIQEQQLQLETEHVDLLDVVREAVAETQLMADQHRIVVEASVTTLLGEWDRSRIAQVLANLLDNAVKYSPNADRVDLSVEREGNDAVIRIADRGPGIALEAREHLFERSFRSESASRSASEGLGLGLYVARGIVEAHGGRLWVESRPGGGSIFAFSLPLDSAAQRSSGDSL